MSSPSILQSPYLVTSRQFPQDPSLLEPVLSKMYFDVASAVNTRQLGIFDKFQTATGERWFSNGDPQNKLQSFRQVYTATSITNGTTSIASGITIDANTQFVNIYGTAISRTTNLAIPLPYVNVAAPADGVTLRINIANANIEIVATTANYTSYSVIVVLEYILNN